MDDGAPQGEQNPAYRSASFFDASAVRRGKDRRHLYFFLILAAQNGID